MGEKSKGRAGEVASPPMLEHSLKKVRFPSEDTDHPFRMAPTRNPEQKERSFR